MITSEDDIKYALSENTPESFSIDEINDISAEVPGGNDEFNWWWIIELKSGKYALVSGWCDYTGWDCQSGIEEFGIFDTPVLAANESPEVEEYSKRSIRKNLIGQLNGTYPKFTYWEQ